MKVQIYYHQIGKDKDQGKWDQYYQRLPDPIRKRCFQYISGKNKITSLLGYLLLLEGLENLSFSKSVLAEIKYTDLERPFLNNEIDFNISHSDRLVACAILEDGKVGIDLEKIREISFTEFEDSMSETQWKMIRLASNPIAKFFDFWTRKESILKAVGVGLTDYLDQIDVENNPVFFQAQNWFLKHLSIAEGYSSHLATNRKISNIQMHHVDF